MMAATGQHPSLRRGPALRGIDQRAKICLLPLAMGMVTRVVLPKFSAQFADKLLAIAGIVRTRESRCHDHCYADVPRCAGDRERRSVVGLRPTEDVADHECYQQQTHHRDTDRGLRRRLGTGLDSVSAMAPPGDARRGPGIAGWFEAVAAALASVRT
jgi:hypothetical protein